MIEAYSLFEVEILVREEAPILSEKNPHDAFLALAGQDLVDPEAYKRLRSASTL